MANTKTKRAENVETIEARKIPFGEIMELSEQLVDVLFHKDEETGETFFLYAYKEILIRMFELASSFPGVVSNDTDILEFAEHYLNGEFDFYVDKIKDDTRIRYLEDAINSKIKNVFEYGSTARLLGNVNKLVTSVTTAIEKYADNAENINPEEMTEFVRNFGDFVTKVTPDNISEAVLKKSKSSGRTSTAKQSAKGKPAAKPKTKKITEKNENE